MRWYQVMSRTTALIYNWRPLFDRLAIPERHVETITSRPTAFFEWLRLNAAQLTWAERWCQILSLTLIKFLRGQLLASPSSMLEVDI